MMSQKGYYDATLKVCLLLGQRTYLIMLNPLLLSCNPGDYIALIS